MHEIKDEMTRYKGFLGGIAFLGSGVVVCLTLLKDWLAKHIFSQDKIIDPLTILAAFGPLAVDLGKSLIAKFIAPDNFKPATIEQYVAMKQVDLDMFKAMNEAGGSNPSYPWVEAIMRLMRPFVGALVLGTWAYMEITGDPSVAVSNFASAVGFYLFGDRTLFYANKK